MAMKTADLAYTTLSSGCGPTDTTIAVGSAASFPALGVNDFTILTLSSGTTREVVKATAITGNAITIARAQGGTSAHAFTTGARVELRLCAAVVDSMATELRFSVWSFSGTPGQAGVLLSEAHDGDLFLNLSTSDLYKRSGGAWGTPIVNLKGAQGIQGVQGVQGIQGPTGSGDVNGPASSTDSAFALFSGTGGKTLKEASIATGKILGRTTAGSGPVEALALTSAGAAMLAAADAAAQLALLAASAPKYSLWVPAAAMASRATNGPSSGSVETSTNKVMLKTLDFDTATVEYAQFSVQMPKGWNAATVTFQAVWSHAATATNFGVTWGLQAVAMSDDDASDTAFGTGATVDDAGGTTDDHYHSPISSAITIGNEILL
ncbi:MAG: hypothetical protein HQL95_00330 [Magnetococcales bacterium]|nr:hypothetical protein [Magnetococcales bacterium]